MIEFTFLSFKRNGSFHLEFLQIRQIKMLSELLALSVPGHLLFAMEFKVWSIYVWASAAKIKVSL